MGSGRGIEAWGGDEGGRGDVNLWCSYLIMAYMCVSLE